MIDIKTLKQYPLSFKLLEQWVEQKHTTSLALLLDKVTNEDLVEFLDENHVFISIQFASILNKFMFDIDTSIDWDFDNLIRDSRKEATEAAIQKAFELLEQKLKVN